MAQRFGSAVNLNLHFYAVFLDGVYHRRTPQGARSFVASPELDDASVATLLTEVRRKVAQLFVARGLLDEHSSDRGQHEPLLAVVKDLTAIRKILNHLGLGQLSGSPRGPP